MKNATVQGYCCLALAVMAGAVGAHWFSVKQTLALAAQLPPRNAVPAVIPAPEDPAVREARKILAEAKAANSKRELPTVAAATITPPAGGAEQDGRIDRLISSCEALMAQNTELKNQVAETNRDLMALQFQVDSHSESFRPLKIAEDPAPMPSSGVLPPKQAP